jgi:hypothetical protein
VIASRVTAQTVPSARRESMSGQTVKSEPTAADVARLVGAWLFVGVPLAWGIYATLQKAAQLFR